MEAVGRLAGGVAHDFNNLLTVIMGYGELLQTRFEENSPEFQELGEIRKAGESAASLTRQLLAFSRRQTIQPRVLDINEIVANMEKMLHRLLGQDIRLITDYQQELASVTADTGQLEQVILNIAVNARDAMPRGGSLIIRTQSISLDDKACKSIQGAQPGEYVCLSMEDSGHGISREVKEHIFEPFFTTRKGGTGLDSPWPTALSASTAAG